VPDSELSLAPFAYHFDILRKVTQLINEIIMGVDLQINKETINLYSQMANVT
jgi:Ion transport protein